MQESPEAIIRHYYYLAKRLKDPTEELAGLLQSRIGQTGTVIGWYIVFEKSCNSEMGKRVGKYREFFRDINKRMYDLMNIFKQGYYVHKNFHGSASLKKVLSAMVPKLKHSALDISDGLSASYGWYDMLTKDISQPEKDKIFNDLLKYSKLDTLAMVRILEKLNKIVQ